MNGKSLDMRTRLPQGFDALVARMRKLAGEVLTRGNLQVSLQLENDGTNAGPVVNETALKAVLDHIEKLQKHLGSPPPRAEQILSMKGVLEVSENADPADREGLENALHKSFASLLENLRENRLAEGKAIADVLESQLAQTRILMEKIEADPSRSLEKIRSRLKEQVQLLLETSDVLDESRLHQEAAILATKADLREELDRLNAHLDAAHKLLSDGGPIGRKLDFLCQEFVRECNTICSKSNAASVTGAGLEMKVVIDQFREQVQNLE